MKRIAKFYRVSPEQFRRDYSGPLDPDTVYASVTLPERATVGSAGYDFCTPCGIRLQPGESVKIPTGIRAEIAEGWVLLLYPRSGLGFRYRMQLDNTVGVIDSDYFHSDNEGHIMVRITNDSNEGKVLEIPAGAGFVQGIFMEYGITEDDCCEAVRNGGFGSTDRREDEK